MKLYEVPRNTQILAFGQQYMFFNIDGMFSYCEDMQGNPVHLNASTEVEIVDEKTKKQNSRLHCPTHPSE